MSGFAVATLTGNMWLGVGAAMLAGAVLALLFGVLAISFKANQVAVGLALAIFGTGLSSFIGKTYVGQAIVLEPSALSAALAKIPLVGGLLGQFHPLVWLSWVLFGADLVVPLSHPCGSGAARGRRSRRAPPMRIGYKVVRIRYLATLFGGAMAGVGGAYISLVYTSLWTEGLVAGRGWIAVGARGVRHLAPGPLPARRLSVRRRHHRAAVRPGRGSARADRVDVGAALHRNHRRPGADLPRRARSSASTCRRRSASRSTPKAEIRAVPDWRS